MSSEKLCKSLFSSPAFSGYTEKCTKQGNAQYHCQCPGELPKYPCPGIALCHRTWWQPELSCAVSEDSLSTGHTLQGPRFPHQVLITPALAPETQTRKTEINLFQHTALSNTNLREIFTLMHTQWETAWIEFNPNLSCKFLAAVLQEGNSTKVLIHIRLNIFISLL